MACIRPLAVITGEASHYVSNSRDEDALQHSTRRRL
jgi:hypothetical protein